MLDKIELTTLILSWVGVALIVGSILIYLTRALWRKKKVEDQKWRTELHDEIINAKLAIKELKRQSEVQHDDDKHQRAKKFARYEASLNKVYENLGPTVVQYNDGSFRVF